MPPWKKEKHNQSGTETSRTCGHCLRCRLLRALQAPLEFPALQALRAFPALLQAWRALLTIRLKYFPESEVWILQACAVSIWARHLPHSGCHRRIYFHRRGTVRSAAHGQRSRDFMFPSHVSEEIGYMRVAQELHLDPWPHLNMRLGEGAVVLSPSRFWKLPVL